MGIVFFFIFAHEIWWHVACTASSELTHLRSLRCQDVGVLSGLTNSFEKTDMRLPAPPHTSTAAGAAGPNDMWVADLSIDLPSWLRVPLLVLCLFGVCFVVVCLLVCCLLACLLVCLFACLLVCLFACLLVCLLACLLILCLFCVLLVLC